MNLSYFKIKLDKETAVKRLNIWRVEGNLPKERADTTFTKVLELSVDDNGNWKGDCLFVYEKDGWTIFEDLSGGFSFVRPENWKTFAKKDDLIVAGYNNAVPCAEFTEITNGHLQKAFRWDKTDEKIFQNTGTASSKIHSFSDVADFIDDDNIYSDVGELIIY